MNIYRLQYTYITLYVITIMETEPTTMQLMKSTLTKFREARVQYQAKVKKELTNDEFILELIKKI